MKLSGRVPKMSVLAVIVSGSSGTCRAADGQRHPLPATPDLTALSLGGNADAHKADADSLIRVVSAAFLLESTPQVWAHTGCRIALGPVAKAVPGHRYSLRDDRPQTIADRARLALARHGARLTDQRVRVLRRSEFRHVDKARRQHGEDRGAQYLAEQRFVLRARAGR